MAALDDELQRCARLRWSDPVAFAWSARRCTEAILMAVLADVAPDALRSVKVTTVDGLLRHEKLKRDAAGSPIPRDIHTVIESLQGFGNTAAHFQVEDVDHARNADDVARSLARVVEWFYKWSQGEAPARARELLAMMDDRRAPPTRSEYTDQPAQQVALQEALARVDELERALHRQERERPRWRWLLLTVLGAVGVAVVLVAAVKGPSRIEPRPGPSAPTETDAGEVEAPPVNESRVDAAMPEDAPPPSGCPEGFVYVPPTDVMLSPYPLGDRPWGPLVGTGQPVLHVVEGFCLQRAPVTLAELRETGGGLSPTPGCRGPNAPSGKVSCVLRAEAVAHCEAKWPDRHGRIPTVEQWETVARAVDAGRAERVEPWTGPTQRNLEWVADAFPAEVFQRGPTRAGEWMTRGPIPERPYAGSLPRHSWNHHAEGRDMHIGFRCVVDPR